MYKSDVYCLNQEYEVETKGLGTTYTHEGMVYIQNEDGEEVFAVNKDRLEAISLNSNVEKEEKELIYNQDDAIDFIAKDLNMSADRNGLIKEILESEEDYMRSVGIIEE